jgi:hypothetical protein
MALSEAIAPAFARRECEHIAAIIKSADELPALLATFYALGAARNGWLVHGSLPDEAATDRERLGGAGVDVACLEATGQLAVLELDLSLTPEEWVAPWSVRLDERLAAGYDALWFSRFPIGPTDRDVAGVLPYEAAWMECFRGRRVVTLCPYISGGIDDRTEPARLERVAGVHDRLLDLTAG